MVGEIAPDLSARTMTVAEFAAKCLALIDEVNKIGVEIVITKRGRPVAKLAPYRTTRGEWFGRDRDIIEIHGDIIEPVDVEWEAEADPDRVLDP